MSTQSGSDQAQADGFMRGTDSTVFEPGMTFPVTWGFKNTGTTTWDGRYTLVYSLNPHPETAAHPRAPLAEWSSYAITEIGATGPVPPGATVRLTVKIVAPRAAGTHATNWQLQAPDGARFGPIRWTLVTVQESSVVAGPAPRPPADQGESASTGAAFSPDEWRSVIWDITGVFESGGRRDAYQNADAGIVSYGKHQATLQSGNLERVLNAYFQRSQSPASQALQQEYAARVQRKEESLRHDGRFRDLLIEAAKEQEMAAAQDEVFEDRFYQSSITRAQQLGLTSPLGLACVYDTLVQGGLDYVLEPLSRQLGVKAVGETGPDGPVNEATWLAAFLNEREARLHRLAALREKENKTDDALYLRNSTFRVAELRKLLNAGNLNLTGDFVVHRQRIRGLRERLTTRSEQKEAETVEAAKIDLLPYLKGDGRQYEIKNAWGSQERVQTQEDASNFYHVKNAQWEQFFYDNKFIYRDMDTSPGNNRYYRQKDADLPRGSRWLPRRMAVGQTHTQARHVQFYNKADGARSVENSGPTRDEIRFIAHHPKYKFHTGIELHDVIELEWVNGRERYFYAKNYGLVGWERKHEDPHTPPWSAISEIHPPNTRDPFARERVTVA